jgi:hypothetical protein
MHPFRRFQSLRARCTLIATLTLVALTTGGCSTILSSLLNGDDDWFDSSDSCNDHSRRHAAAPAPADPNIAFPPNTR